MNNPEILYLSKTRPVNPALFWLWGLIIGCLLLSACSREPEPEPEFSVLRLAGSTMGTTYHVTVVAPATFVDGQAVDWQAVDAQRLQQDIDQLLVSVNQQMSTYIADSELMIFNQAEVGEWFSVSDELLQVLQLSQQIHRASGGAFDITVGPLVELWGFGARQADDAVPPADAIAALLESIGADKLVVDMDLSRVRKLGEIRLDLSAIAKGFGADRVSDLLARNGHHNSLVEIGGELRLRGLSQRGTPWKIGVEAPQLSQGVTQKAILVTDAAVATSGDYRNYFESHGKRYSHTLDPRTGFPVQHKLASVTVIASSAAEADAWATALSVLGPEQALVLVEELNLAAFFIIRAGDGFTESYSSAFAPYLLP